MQPYRIKVVEPLPHVSPRTRKRVLTAAGYNTFGIPAKYVKIDLISDSGTGAMTADQWSAMVRAREDFAGQEAMEDFTTHAQRFSGFRYIQPVHQGRSAESILFNIILKKGDVVLANTHFQTTRANIQTLGCRAIDLPSQDRPFLGNIDIDKLKSGIRSMKRVRAVILTVTNNIKGGQPVSIENIAATREITRKHGILLILDACRFADNAYLLKEHGKMKAGISELCRRMFGYSDILYLSSKKDGLVNIGGFIGLRDKELYEHLGYEVLRRESYPSSGGLAARDLAAMSLGLAEATNEDFLHAHISSIRTLARILKEHQVSIFEPVGGHAVVIQPKDQSYFSFAFAAQVFLKAGIRGGVFQQYFRLAIPRRVYTSEHLKYVGESIGELWPRRLPKLRLVNEPSEFFNFFARFAPV
jgi:tryptophanase